MTVAGPTIFLASTNFPLSKIRFGLYFTKVSHFPQNMSQTLASQEALRRDRNFCQWCLEHYGRLRCVYDYVFGYHPFAGGSHHILRRGRVDEADAIVGLCAECHTKAERGKEPTKSQLAELMLKRYGIDLRARYPQYFKD